MHFSRQKLGHVQIIGIHGPNKEICQQYHWLFLNHGAHLRDACWLEKSPLENFTCIFSTTIKKLKKAFLSMERIKLETELDSTGQLDNNKREKNGFKKNKGFSVVFQNKIQMGANKRFNDLEERSDLYYLLKSDGNESEMSYNL